MTCTIVDPFQVLTQYTVLAGTSGYGIEDVMSVDLAEQHDEWIEGRRYLGLDVLARSRTDKCANATRNDTEEVAPALTA